MIREQPEQVREATNVLRSVLGTALLALYLHGSAVSGGLRPQSDIDLLAVIDRPMTDSQRRDLVSALLRTSGRHPNLPGGPRCLEVMVFLLSEIAAADFPVQAEFIYGEWLRNRYEAGEMPMPARDPDTTLVLAQARHEALPLIGQSAGALLPRVCPKQLHQAMRDLLPALREGVRGDERNVLLTLARMWRTARTGDFVAKDVAAAWAIPQLCDRDATSLSYARRGYLGEISDDWESRREAAQQAAKHMSERVTELLRSR